MKKKIINQSSLNFDYAGMQTPVMQQYQSIKKKHPDKILLFRLGDFYEIFGQDAVTSAEILQIQLTSRSRDKKNSLPMCGVPVHALDNYLYKLVQAGYKVAICDQIKVEANYKGLIDRKVVQIVTPGTVYSEKLIANDQLHYIASLAPDYVSQDIGVIFCDITTGEVLGQTYNWLKDKVGLLDSLALNSPIEILLPQPTDDASKRWLTEIVRSIDNIYQQHKKYSLEYCSNDFFDPQICRQIVDKQYKLKPQMPNFTDQQSICALGAIIRYLQITQFSDLPYLESPKPITLQGRMNLDDSTLHNLDIFSSTHNQAQMDLYTLLNKTVTPIGARALKDIMRRPFCSIDQIEARLAACTELLAKNNLLVELRKNLKAIGDLERYCARLSLPNMSPSNLSRLKTACNALPPIDRCGRQLQASFFKDLWHDFDLLTDITTLLNQAIESEYSDTAKDFSFIKEGYNEKLDELRGQDLVVKNKLLQIEKKERAALQNNTLKVGYNRIFGYYLEISKKDQQQVPSYYIHRQTLANTVRYSTQQLQEIEQLIAEGNLKIQELQEEIYGQLLQSLVNQVSRIKSVARVLSQLDVIASMAIVSELRNYCRPIFLKNQPAKLAIRGGRHPLVELIINKSFITNDCNLDWQQKKQVLIITGPNMGGKSTFMRQVALIAYMAQIGCYVPAQSVQLTVFDKIFTRVGASDNIYRGQSTFMLEMQEAANILKTASSNSLVIIDELGRGTSTYDGISLAWAIIEKLVQIRALTFFSTHYFELTKICYALNEVHNCHVEAKEQFDSLIFNYKIKNGPISRSYGVQVAKLAGLPDDVIKKAWAVFEQLSLDNKDIMDEKTVASYKAQLSADLSEPEQEDKFNIDLQLIKNLDINNTTPVECLEILTKLQQKLK